MFEPQLPYMYVPPDDFISMLEAIASIYPDSHCSGANGGACYFN